MNATTAIMYNNYGHVIKKQFDVNVLTDLCINEIVFVCDDCLFTTKITDCLENSNIKSNLSYESNKKDKLCKIASTSKTIKKQKSNSYKKFEKLFDKKNQTELNQNLSCNLLSNNHTLQFDLKESYSSEKIVFSDCKKFKPEINVSVDNIKRLRQKFTYVYSFEQNKNLDENKTCSSDNLNKYNNFNITQVNQNNQQIKQPEISKNDLHSKIDAYKFFKNIKMKNASQFCILCNSLKKNNENINYLNQNPLLQISYANRFFVLNHYKNYFIIKFYQIDFIQPNYNFYFNSIILNAHKLNTNNLYAAYIPIFYEDCFLIKLHNKFKSNHGKSINNLQFHNLIGSNFIIQQNIFQSFFNFQNDCLSAQQNLYRNLKEYSDLQNNIFNYEWIQASIVMIKKLSFINLFSYKTIFDIFDNIEKNLIIQEN
ncbi:hypothetical protein GVAV_000454 [Gurleya vavrai]